MVTGNVKKRNFERRNAQTSRAGWRPQWNGLRQLAEDIAESMRQHPERNIRHYTTDEELIAMVETVLEAK